MGMVQWFLYFRIAKIKESRILWMKKLRNHKKCPKVNPFEMPLTGHKNRLFLWRRISSLSRVTWSISCSIYSQGTVRYSCYTAHTWEIDCIPSIDPHIFLSRVVFENIWGLVKIDLVIFNNFWALPILMHPFPTNGAFSSQRYQDRNFLFH